MFPIDLRSDTVTVPSQEMRAIMAGAEVGDDVYMDDPTVKKLEEKAAEMLGKEAAIYAVSGTMGNLVAILTHEVSGKAVMAGRECHIVNYEGGGVSSLAGAFCQQVCDDAGLPDIADMEKMFRDGSNIHFAQTKLLCLENTHNRRGGTASTVAEMKACTDWARKHGLATHLDGARIFNAAVCCGEKVSDYCALVDSVQICLSKGLGAPMGSLICGTKEFIDRARYWRKRVGGGLRQVGIVAAAGLYAIENNVARLAEDHENAKTAHEMLDSSGMTTLKFGRPTNMVYFRIKDEAKTGEFLEACLKRGVKFGAMSPGLFRIVFHLNVSRDDSRTAIEIIKEEAKRMGVA